MVVTVYSATLTWTHAVVLLRVLTVETGTSLMEAGCNLAVALVTYMNNVQLSELTCVVGTMVTHLVYIAVLLRPMQSTVMISQTTQHERLCM